MNLTGTEYYGQGLRSNIRVENKKTRLNNTKDF